ncbi:MAG: hypothetical protein K2K25_03705 [Muribaculaceae bacterium]|nr:hypothetical protein [Muribaculaceae bacterium]
MKKIFLMMAAGLIATSAFSQKKVYEIDYATTDWNFYVMGYTPEKGDGCIVSNNPMEGDDGGPSWYQYFIADQIPTKVDESYSVVVNCKASEAVTVGMNMGWGWGDGEQINSSLSIPTDWTEVEVDFKKPVGGTSCNVVLQPGGSTATIYIKSVTVYQNPPAAQYTTEDVETVNYAELSEYPYEDFGVKPVIADGVLSFPEDGDMFSAIEGISYELDTLYGVKTKIKGSKAGTVRLTLGYWGETQSVDLDVTEDWTEYELPVGAISSYQDNAKNEGFVIIYTKDEDSNIYYDGVLEMEYCTVAVFTEIPPVVIPTEWVSIVGNCNANDGESKNLIDRNPSIDAGGIQYAEDYKQEHDAYAFICDNPVASEGGKVYYCPINADPTQAWDSQFFILFDEPVSADTPMKVSFDYYCSDTRNIDTQAHGLPGNYHHYVCIGTLNAKPEWQHHAWEGEVSASFTSGNDDGEAGFIAIAFNLSSAPEEATFYINNVIVQIEKEIGGDPGAVETVNAIIVPAKGVYNLQGVKVANSLEEVAAPGLYISNGKKVVKK